MTQDKALKVLKTGINVFLTGEPGSGKSYTIRRFCQWLQEEHIPYAMTASTGIAATHVNGVTIHSWSGVGIKEVITDRDIENVIDNKPYLVRKMNMPRVLIIDEISMLSAQTLNNIDQMLRGVRNTLMTGEPFGGMQIVVVGDFYQLPPVSKMGKKVEFAFSSQAWKDAQFTCCYLHEQHRQSEDAFIDILTAIRERKLEKKHIDILKSHDHGDLNLPKTQLFTHNIDADRINMMELQNISGEEKIFKMSSEGNEYLVEMLKKNCLSPEILKLKIGATVMLTRNKFEEDGTCEYVNGTLGEIVGYYQDQPVVQTVDGRRIIVARAEWSIEENDYDGGRKVVAAIKQFPLKLAWAITIHKSQGMSLDAATIDLSKVFECGQGYVAVSRVRSLAGITIQGKLSVSSFEVNEDAYARDTEFHAESDLNDNRY